MLYLLELEKDLDIHPKFFGKHLREIIHEKLVHEVEGTCSGKYGYIIAVTSMDAAGSSPGKVRQDGTGFATFRVKYQAIVSRPYKGEVVDCIVTSVNKMGFFAEAGPVQVFVSNHLIGDDLEFNATGDPCYQAQDGTRIQEGSEVRIRIVGTKIDESDIFCIGSIKDDFLGPISS